MKKITKENQTRFVNKVLKNKQFRNAVLQLEQVLHRRGYEIKFNVEYDKVYIELLESEMPPRMYK